MFIGPIDRASTGKYEILIGLVGRERVDLSTITKSFLLSRIKQTPELAEQLLVSERVDQHYQLRVLVDDQSNIVLHEFERLLNGLTTDGSYARLMEQYGQAPPH